MTKHSHKRPSASRRSGTSRNTPRIPLEKFLRYRGKRRGWYVAITLVVALLLVIADRTGLLVEPGDDMTRYDGQTFTVTRVIDGDTLDLNVPDGDEPTTRIRLWGVDTPEKARQDPPTPAEPFANEATDLTRDLVQGKRVRLTLEPHRQRGNYGRLLAFVELSDGSTLNEALIAAGLAHADDRWPHRHIKSFESLERQARKAGVGLWGKPN